MITVAMSTDEFEYDVFGLTKAFYPDAGLKLIRDLKEIPDGILLDNKIYKDIEKGTNIDHVTIQCDLFFLIYFDSTCIKLQAQTETEVLFYESVLCERQDKPGYRNQLKKALYRMYQFMTGKDLLWGTLTGVRPTKIAFEKLEAGLSEEETLISLQKDYYLKGEKADLSLLVAKRELALLRELDYKNGYSIYIGIPFCPTTCLYCSFTSYPKEKYEAMIEPYLNALYKEIEYAKTCFPEKKLSTVYIGGGTPTTLTAEQLDKLLTVLNQSLNMSQVKEFTVEAGRPDSITMEKLLVLKKHGVTRISINPQSMQQKTLDLIGRKHTITEVTKAFHMAREAGHNNINMDIIIGLPGETYEDVSNTLEEINNLNPDSLTVHTLAVKRAARLNIEKNRYEDTKESEAERMLSLTLEYAKSANYQPYYLYRQKSAKNLENTGYARYGKEGYYNILIMEEQQSILALGAGGLSKFIFHKENRLERVENVKSLKDYIERIDEMILRKHQFLTENAKYL
ncbi:MAG: hypothetical protein K0S61_1161 [Anaerocolumna sp.]|jgi:oxygen-independent coproporphyrinogen-3 oxidase|nr:hypothetical protein [Anaerocolumna sp.]